MGWPSLSVWSFTALCGPGGPGASVAEEDLKLPILPLLPPCPGIPGRHSTPCLDFFHSSLALFCHFVADVGGMCYSDTIQCVVAGLKIKDLDCARMLI